MTTVALVVVGALTHYELHTRGPARVAPPQPPARIQPTTGPSFILGDYGAPIYQPSTDRVPTIDAAATVAALKRAHVNTFAYLICPDPSRNPAVSLKQWQDLPGFAAVAATAGIQIFAYIVPPSEAPQAAYQPFQWDYVAWADSIGRMAANNGSIRGIIIDDFASNLRERSSYSFGFDRSIVAAMGLQARVHAPWFEVLPVLYYPDLVGPRAVLANYRDLVSGVVFPYAGAAEGGQTAQNTRDSSQALAQGLRVGGLVNCPSGGQCTQVVFPGRMGRQTVDGHVGWSTLVKADDARQHVLSLSTNDDTIGVYRPYRVDVLVNGTLAGTIVPRAGWSQASIDVTSAVRAKSESRIEFRLSRLPNGGFEQLVVQIADVRITNTNSSIGWQLEAPDSHTGIRVSAIRSQRLIYMTYAIPLSSEAGQGASKDYVGTVLQSVDLLRQLKLVQGSLIFNLPLPQPGGISADPKYEVVRRIYERWDRG